jgi:two-component system, response regulator, stage 0 sporulation protein F
MARILTIDDSALTRNRVCKILRSQGFEVLEASNGKIGLEIIQAENLDCILLDLLMPELDGWHLLKILKEQHIPVPVVVLTADLQDTTQHRCSDLGAVAVIHKLPNPSILLEAVSLALSTFSEQSLLVSQPLETH